jgi:hypothetical protein
MSLQIEKWLFVASIISNNVVLGQDFSELPFDQKSDNKYEYIVTVSNRLPKYKFSIITKDGDENIEGCKRIVSIEVRKGKSNKVIQKLILPIDPIDPFDPRGQVAVDLNFDGNMDFLVGLPSGNSGSNYAVWVFDPHSGMFTYNAKYSDLTNPAIDWNTKTISSYSHFSAAEGDSDIYQVRNDSLLLIKEVSIRMIRIDDSTNGFVKTTRWFGGHKIQAVKIDTMEHK